MKDIKLNDGDLYVVNGSLQLCEKEEKLNQQVGKSVITTIGNYLHPNYGSIIFSLLGKGQGVGSDGDIKSSLRDALNFFIKLQKSNILLGKYEAEEILYKVLSINVSHADPRSASPSVLIMNGKQNNIEVTLSV